MKSATSIVIALLILQEGIALSIEAKSATHVATPILGTETVTGHLTFYGAGDNCPPGGEIAYPVLHKEAGGNGTYDDPITCASDKSWLPKGTKVYIEAVEKYFIMEDDVST